MDATPATIKAILIGTDGKSQIETRRFALSSSLSELRDVISKLFFRESIAAFQLSFTGETGEKHLLRSDEDFQNFLEEKKRNQGVRLTVHQESSACCASSSPNQKANACADMRASSEANTVISFTLNGENLRVQNPNPQMSLAEYLRTLPGFTGTKLSCQEGGCGACVVLQTSMNAATEEIRHRPINACLCPVVSVHNSSITTIEGLKQKNVPHPVQTKIVEHHGTQCGFCTPGFVMSMYALLKNKSAVQGITADEVQDQFDGNICRCTGYRPILDAMQSFVCKHSDTDAKGISGGSMHTYTASAACDGLKTDECRDGQCLVKTQTTAAQDLDIDPTACKKCTANGLVWHQPYSLDEVYTLIRENAGKRVKLAVGNTASGIFKDDAFDVVIALHHVYELKRITITDEGVTFGAAVVIQDMIDSLDTLQSLDSTLLPLIDHLRLVASRPIRNAASWAGNIAITCQHRNFQSDVFTVLAAAKARIQIATVGADGTIKCGVVDCMDVLSFDLTQSIMIDVFLPIKNMAAGSSTSDLNLVVKTFKVMMRPQNAHAVVNAGFRSSLDASLVVQDQPTIVFGGVKTSPARATSTEQFLIGKSLQSEEVLREALKILEQEMAPEPSQRRVEYRRNLVSTLFYKYILGLQPKLPPDLQTAVIKYKRPIAKGRQFFTPDEAVFPVSKPLKKIEALAQASGQAVYTDDIPVPQNCLFAAFVTSKVANADIASIDISDALKVPGIVDVLTAADIPGSNDWSMPGVAIAPEEILASEHVYYYGQAVALVVARSQRQADEIARSDIVKVTYTNAAQKLILSISDAVAEESFHWVEPSPVQVGDVESGFASSSSIITGTVSLPHQYHFHLETQACLVVPGEDDEYTIYSASQSVTATQATAARALGLDAAKFNVIVKRLGGAFGGKIDRCLAVSTAVAVAASKLRAPVKSYLPLDTNMMMLGKRPAYSFDYKVGVDETGKLQAVELHMFADVGWSLNGGGDSELAMLAFDNVYHCPNWMVDVRLCKTDLASSTYARSPGFAPAVFIAENILDHISRDLQLPSDSVREINFYHEHQVTPYGQTLEYCNIHALFSELKAKAKFNERRIDVEVYNSQNRWTKRGIYLTPVKYGLSYSGNPHCCQVNIYGCDGSIQIIHSGIECGQGINTKVAQAVAYTLSSQLGIEVPMNKITVVSTNATTTPNSSTTGGSVTSELNCLAATNACSELATRMQPVIGRMTHPSWSDAVAACNASGMQLHQSSWVNTQTKEPFKYNSYSAACTEVQVDILTGECNILRTDILFDCGVSLNPAIDVGQVEGAYVMGLGHYMHESLDFDAATGALLTHNTWTYKPPCSKSWPAEFNIELLPNAPNPAGVLRSKASGEPPLLLACGALFAAKDAVAAARRALGVGDGAFRLDAPASPERLRLACALSPELFRLT